MKKLYEVVATFDVEPIVLATLDDSSEQIQYRLEVLREVGTDLFKGKVYRQEFFRLLPSFPQESGVPMNAHQCDELVFVEDHFYYPESLEGNSVQDVVNKFQKCLNGVYKA